MSAVQVEVVRTRSDILKGIAANVLRSPAAFASYLGGALVVAVIAVVVNTDETMEAMIGAGLVAFVGMLFVYLVIQAICVPLAARKSWSSPGMLEPVKFTFSDEGLGVESNVGHGTTSWIIWKGAFETNSLIVIRHQMNLLHIVPKRDLSANAIAGIRSILKKHIKNAHLRMETAA